MATKLGHLDDMRVRFVDRLNGTPIGLPQRPSESDGGFNMVLDGTGGMAFRVPVDGRANGSDIAMCCGDLQRICPWQTEAEVLIGGIPFFVGPVTRVQHAFGQTIIETGDMTSYWDRRTVGDLDLSGDLATIFEVAHDNAIAADGPNVTVSSTPSGVVGERFIDEYDYVILSEFLNELAAAGVDYVSVGRTIHVRGSEDITPSASLSDKDFLGALVVDRNGRAQANRIIVIGNAQDAANSQTPVIAIVEDTAAIARDGLIVRVFRENHILDQNSADQSALSKLAALVDPLSLQMPNEAQISPDAPVCIDQLIPGNVIQVSHTASCYPLSRQFRVTRLSVSWDGKVQISLQPLGDLL